MRREPVWLPEDAEARNGRISQTFARNFDRCRRSAYLYATVRGGGGAALDRGSALHTAIERCVETIVGHGENYIPADVAKAILEEVLAEQDVPLAEHDYLRESVARWAQEWTLDPQRVVACETLLELDVGGFVVRCKVDYAELSQDGSTLTVRDWKSSRAMPAQEDVARKRPDGSFSAKSFQLVLYALALVFGVPVRRTDCVACGGRGEQYEGENHTGDPQNDPLMVDCPDCRGRGYVEEREPFPLASRAQMVDAAFVYPGIEAGGRMATRACTLTPLELHEYRDSLAALCRRVGQAVETGDWRARPGSWCHECPAPFLCPIPPVLRSYMDRGAVAAAGYINSREDAIERLALVDRAKATVAAWEKEIKAWSKAHGGEPVPMGDLEFGWVTSSSEQIVDREGLWAAIESGRSIERSQFVRVRSGTRWASRPAGQEGSADAGSEREAA